MMVKRYFSKYPKCKDKKYAPCVVAREQLAEYFRYLWLRKQQQEKLLCIMFKELENAHAVLSNFPYAGVKPLLEKGEEHFLEVFKTGLQDWHKSYDKLTS